MDLYTLRSGDLVRTVDGDVVRVESESQDGEWILARYVESAGAPHLVGTEDLCHANELAEKITTGASEGAR